MSHVHVILFCKLIGATIARRWKSTTFPADVTRLCPHTRLSPPFIFEDSAWETRPRAERPWLVRTLVVKSHFECIHTHRCLQDFNSFNCIQIRMKWSSTMSHNQGEGTETTGNDWKRCNLLTQHCLYIRTWLFEDSHQQLSYIINSVCTCRHISLTVGGANTILQK